MSRNSKAKRDARRKQRPRGAVAEPREPEAIRNWVLARDTPEVFIRWATSYLAGWDGDENDDGRHSTAMDMFKEYVTHGPGGRPLSEPEIDDLQGWTAQQCAEFARQVQAAA